MGIERLSLSSIGKGAALGGILGAGTALFDVEKFNNLKIPLTISFTKYDIYLIPSSILMGAAIGFIFSMSGSYSKKSEEDSNDTYIRNR